jgi:hypothetical protein
VFMEPYNRKVGAQLQQQLVPRAGRCAFVKLIAFSHPRFPHSL